MSSTAFWSKPKRTNELLTMLASEAAAITEKKLVRSQLQVFFNQRHRSRIDTTQMVRRWLQCALTMFFFFSYGCCFASQALSRAHWSFGLDKMLVDDMGVVFGFWVYKVAFITFETFYSPRTLQLQRWSTIWDCSRWSIRPPRFSSIWPTCKDIKRLALAPTSVVISQLSSSRPTCVKQKNHPTSVISGYRLACK